MTLQQQADAIIHRAARSIAEPIQVTLFEIRPGVICAWHPGFDPRDSRNAGMSHGMCEACEEKFVAEMKAEDK